MTDARTRTRAWRSFALVATGIASLALLAGCSSSRRPGDWATVREVTPAFLDSLQVRDPAIAADSHGRVAFTYVTRDTSGARELWLTVSRDSGETFSPPIRVNTIPGSVSSYPEGRPAAWFGPSGQMIVMWAQRRPGVERAVDVVARASGDGGITLGPLAYLNDDHASDIGAFHGFPTVAFRSDGAVFAAWLDERDYATYEGEAESGSSLYAALSFDGGQTWSGNQVLRDTVCACCRPMVATDDRNGIAVAYRSANLNLRDPALTVSRDGGTTFEVDTVLQADRWYLEGCPDVGPVLTWNRESGGHYAWFTGAGEPGVYVLPWRPDGGPAGVRRALRDSLDRATRPRMAPLGETTLIGLEARPAADTAHTVFAVRALEPSGALTPWMFLGGNVKDAWLAGADARSAFACWLERDGESARPRLVRLVRRPLAGS